MSGRAGKSGKGCRSKTTFLAVLIVFPILPVFPVFPVLPAQATRLTGQVTTADSTPVRGARVVLHQVAQEEQGPIDSTHADSRGRFSFVYRPDTTALYLLSSSHAGIEYFSPPLPNSLERVDTGIRIVVYDTSTLAAVALQGRHLVLARPGGDGSRSILDLLTLRNAGRLTRVAPDTMHPSWSAALPAGTTGLRVSEGDISPETVSRRGDSLIVTAPIAPGEKQLAIQYQVPPGRRILELPIDEPGVRVNVLAEEPEVRVIGDGLALADTQVIEGRSFRRWTGVVPAAGEIRLTLPRAGTAPRWLLAALVAGLGVSLAAAGWYLLARSRGTVARIRPDELLDAIAALDARYLGRENETPAQEWSSYREERSRLKAELESSLAAHRWSG
jgi:hypothetical protein